MTDAYYAYIGNVNPVAAPVFSANDVRIIPAGECLPPGAVFIGQSLPQMKRRYLRLTYPTFEGYRRWRKVFPKNAWVVKR